MIREGCRGRARATLIVALIVPVAVLLTAPPASAETAEDVPTGIEAWYRTPLVGGSEDPACSGPAGCPFQPAAPADPYPENTLHVGATAGRQDSATFVTFARTGIPFDAELADGTAILPVASSDAGTFQPEEAHLVACLVTEPFKPVQGGPPEEVPKVDCTTSSEAVLQAEADPAHFRVDLAPFIARWNAGVPDNGIGLLAGDGSEGRWHVAFSASQREGEDVAPPITATFTFTTSEDDSPVLPPAPVGEGVSDTPGGDGDFATPGASGGLSAPSFTSDRGAGLNDAAPPEVASGPAGSQEAESVAEPQVADVPPPAPAAATSGYAYPSMWLMPLVLVVGAGALARGLTEDVEVLDEDASRGLLGRLWLAFFPDSASA